MSDVDRIWARLGRAAEDGLTLARGRTEAGLDVDFDAGQLATGLLTAAEASPRLPTRARRAAGVLGATAKGASAGAVLGPYGAAGGAAVGFLVGFVKRVGRRRRR